MARATIAQTVVLATAVWVGAACTAAQAEPGPSDQRFDVVIGAMCIGDMPSRARVVVRTIQQGGDVYEDWRLEWRAEPPSPSPSPPKGTPAKKKIDVKKRDLPQPTIRPIIRFFRTAINAPPGTSCRELKGEVLLSGDVDRIKLEARSSAHGNKSPAQITIGREGLSVAVAHVRSGLAPIFGGTIDLSGSRAWILNYVTLRGVENQPPEGAIEITSWARRIRGAKFILQEGSPVVPVDMSSGRENVTLGVPLDGKYTELVVGAFAGNPPEVKVAQFSVPAATFEQATVDAESLTIERAQRGSDTVVSLTRSAVRYTRAKVSSRQSSATFKGAGSATIDRIVSKGNPSAERLAIRDPSFERLFARGVDCDSEILQSSLVNAGTCTISVAHGSPSAAKLEVKTENVRSLGFAHIFAPTAATTLVYTIDVLKNQETFSGRMTPYVARFGMLRLGTLPDLLFRQTPLSETSGISIPISVDLPSGGGTVTLERDKASISLEARLDQFRLKGTLRLSAADSWTLTVDRKDFAFAVSALVTKTPLLYGGQTEFAGAGVRFEPLSDITLSRSRVTGRLQFSPSLTTVLNPNLQLARTKQGIVLQAPARFSANATLAIDLANGALNVHSGKLLIEKAKARTGEAGYADVGDLRVRSGELTIQKLSAEYAEGLGTVDIAELRAAAEQVSSIPISDGGELTEQAQWSGRPSEALRIGRLRASLEASDSSDALRIQSYLIQDLCLEVRDATYGDPGGLWIVAERLRFCATALGSDTINATLELNSGHVQRKTDTVNGQLSVPRMTINLTGGTPRQPSGSGQLFLAAIGIKAATPIEVRHSCDGHPDFQKIQAETIAGALAASVNLQFNAGIMTGSGAISIPGALLQNTSEYDCQHNLGSIVLVEEVRVVYDYPCPTWRKPFRFCRGWTILVPRLEVGVSVRIHVYKLLVPYLAPSAELRLQPDKTKSKLLMCLGAINVTVPQIAVSYVPVPQTPVPAFDRFVGKLTGWAAAPFESGIANALANFGVILLNLLDATNIRDNCIKLTSV